MLPIILATLENDDERRLAEELYDKYRKLMFHIAMQNVGNKSIAEDMVSEALIKMLRHIKKISEYDCHQQKHYIVLIVRNTCYDYFKKANKQKTEPFEVLELDMKNDNNDNNPLQNLVSTESYEIIVEAILALPEKYKDVAYLSLVSGHSHYEIAKLLNISYDNSKKRLSRAKTIIKEVLRERLVGDNKWKLK